MGACRAMYLAVSAGAGVGVAFSRVGGHGTWYPGDSDGIAG